MTENATTPAQPRLDPITQAITDSTEAGDRVFCRKVMETKNGDQYMDFNGIVTGFIGERLVLDNGTTAVYRKYVVRVEKMKKEPATASTGNEDKF